MKKLLLILSAVAISTMSFAQTFSDGDSVYVMDYVAGTASSSCTDNIAGSNGGMYFPNNYIDVYGYKNPGFTNSEEALKFATTAGNFVGTDDYPLYCDIFYTNDIDYSPAQCEDMKSVSTLTTSVGIDLSKGGNKVFVTAKASVPTTVVFDIAYSNEGAFPATTGRLYDPYAASPDLTGQLSLTTSYVRYEIDYSADPIYIASTLKSKVNMWGIAMFTDGVEVYVNKVEFGIASSVANIKTPTLAKGISVYPNPSAGNAKINTYNRAGKVVITNPFGAVVETIAVSQSQDAYELNLSNKGVYFLNFITDEGSTTEKLVIE